MLKVFSWTGTWIGFRIVFNSFIEFSLIELDFRQNKNTEVETDLPESSAVASKKYGKVELVNWKSFFVALLKRQYR